MIGLRNQEGNLLDSKSRGEALPHGLGALVNGQDARGRLLGCGDDSSNALAHALRGGKACG